MKQMLSAGLAGLVMVIGPAVLAQPSEIWENWGIYSIPPSQDPIDAVNFVNHAGATFQIGTSGLFNTYDTVNFTNQGLMIGNPGFDFQTIPSETGSARMAANFLNLASGAGNGVINCSGAFSFVLSPLLPFGNLTGNSKCSVLASNIINTGSINMDASSLIKLRGNNIDLSHGALTMANPGNNLGLFNAGVLAGYWGVGTAIFNYFLIAPAPGQASLLDPGNIFLNFGGGVVALSDQFNVITRNYQLLFNSQFLFNPTVYFSEVSTFGGSNILTQVVVLVNTNSAVSTKVFFPASFNGNSQGSVVQWQWSSTNFPSGVVSTNNYLYVQDTFGEVTNLQVAIDGFAGTRPTFRPVTYNFFQGAPFSTTAGASPVVPSQVPFIPGTITNDYAGYQAILTAGTQLTSDVAGGDATNMAGRIEVSADKVLNLGQSTISSLNYLLLQSTNHYLGSPGAAISAPTLDLNLRVTNSSLAITNLVAPWLNHPEGTIDLWSARWTNLVGTVTNCFHVTFVNSQFAPQGIPKVQTVKLTVTNSVGSPNNLLISDSMNITREARLSAERLTITTNALNNFTPLGALNFLSPDIVWSTATPGLMYLTNSGIITAQNAVYFGGSRSEPPYGSNTVDVPYQVFVNHGGVTNQATLIWSQYFENDGIFNAGGGSIQLQHALTSVLTNGAFYAPGGEIGIYSDTLFASNHPIVAGAALTFAVTNILDDSSLTYSLDTITNKNFWECSGLNLLYPTRMGSLLATTVENFDPSSGVIQNFWAAPDVGPAPTAFPTNTAVGHLILEGADANSLFSFVGTGGGNKAIYVDELDFRGSIATNVDSSKNYLGVRINPNMKIYYAQALANGISIAERLDGKNGGGFVWVSNYNGGFFSSTNVVYPDGTTNRLNTALVTSCDIDSDGDGIPNCTDASPIPILSPASLALTVAITNSPADAALISWTAFPATTSTLLAAPSSTSTNWQVVTNLNYSGPFPGRLTFTDLIRTNTPRFYRVRVGSQ